MKIGLLGLGQCGGKLVEKLITEIQQSEDERIEFVPLVIDLSRRDLDALKNISIQSKLQIQTRSGTNGTGRNTKVSYGSLSDESNQELFFEKINKLFGLNLDNEESYTFKVQQLFIFFGSGGGTGNGFLQVILSSGLVHSMPKMSVVMASPRKVDSKEEKRNTLCIMENFRNSIIRKEIGSIFVINNDIFTKTEGDWMEKANSAFAKIFTNTLIQSLQDSVKSVDDADLYNIFRENGYGTMTSFDGEPVGAFARTLTNLGDQGYETRGASSYALLVSGNDKIVSCETNLLESINSFSPNVEKIYTGFYPQTFSINSQTFCSISGMSEPKFLIELASEANKVSEKTDISTKIKFSRVSDTNTVRKPKLRPFEGFGKK